MSETLAARSRPEFAPAASIDVSVVIVNWNARDALLACLASLGRHPPSCPWEAIVVDNGSGDGSLAALRATAPWATVIANERNRGLAAANNQGLLASRGAHILLSNPDVLYTDGCVDALRALLERRPGAAFAVPRLLQADGLPQTSAGDLPTLAEALRGSVAARQAGGAPSGFWWHGWAHDEERPIGHGGEAAYLVRRSAVAEIGMQDERFPLDWEGIDWSARVHEAGWEVWLCPSAVVLHEGGVSIRQAPLRWIIQSHVGMYRYFRKRRPAPLAPVLAAAFGARAGVKLARALAGARLYEQAHERARLEEAGDA